MESGFINIVWNRYETALLIDFYLRCKDGILTRKEAASILSHRLREGTLKLGITISDTYRNENGIAMQLAAMEFVMTDRDRGIKHPSKRFIEMANLYSDNRESFLEILNRANEIYPPIDNDINGKDVVDVSNFYSQINTPPAIVVEEPIERYSNGKIKKILSDKFKNGFRLNSFIDLKRLKNFYQTEFGEELEMDDDDIYADVTACGIVIDNRVYLPELMLPEEIREKILTHIKAQFDDGQKSCVYYDVLYKYFHDDLLNTKIFSSTMLREYLQRSTFNEWHFHQTYFSIDADASPDIQQEVAGYVKEQGQAVSEDEVVQDFSHYPEQEVRRAFDAQNTILISCGRNQRFHIDNFVITENELRIVEQLISSTIESHKFICFSELTELMDNKVPDVIENNAIFGNIGIRNALKELLGNQFHYYNNLISSHSDPITPENAFEELSMRDEYTIDDVQNLASACGTIPNGYIETLLQESVRVSENLFVSCKKVHFNVDAIDNELERLIDGDYSPIIGIDMLSILPTCGYTWTPFLLESYIHNHSKAFIGIRPGYFGARNVIGGIVKRKSQITDFISLAAHVISDADIPLEKANILDYLYTHGYIARRSNENVNKIIIESKKLKNKK